MPGLMEGQRNAIRRFANAAGDLYTKLNEQDRAADCYSKAGATLKAAGAFRAAHRLEKAADLYEEAGEFQTASQILESIGQMARASAMAEKAGKITEAAILACKAGQVFRAAGLYARTKDIAQAAELYFQLLIESIDKNAVPQSAGYAARGSQSCPHVRDTLPPVAAARQSRLVLRKERETWPEQQSAMSRGNCTRRRRKCMPLSKTIQKPWSFWQRPARFKIRPCLAETYFQVGRYQEAAQLFVGLEQLGARRRHLTGRANH